MKKQHLHLQESEREQLEKLLSKGNWNVRVQKRALALLELDKGKTYQAVAHTLNSSYATVQGWSKKYAQEGLSLLKDKPRSGRPIEVLGEDKAKITSLACSDAPEGYGRWSLRLLADKVVELGFVESISHTEVGRILKKTNCNLTANDSGA